MTIIIFDGFPSSQKKTWKKVFSSGTKGREVIEQLDRSVMAIRGATRNSNMKYVSTREMLVSVLVATNTKNSSVYPIKIQPDFEQET